MIHKTIFVLICSKNHLKFKLQIHKNFKMAVSQIAILELRPSSSRVEILCKKINIVEHFEGSGVLLSQSRPGARIA